MSIQARKLMSEMGALALLPHHPSTEGEIEAMLQGMRESLLALRARCAALPPPAAVTIARSTEDCHCGDDDGYTPKGQVDWLQERVLRLVGELLRDWQTGLPTSASSSNSSSSSGSSSGGSGAGVASPAEVEAVGGSAPTYVLEVHALYDRAHAPTHTHARTTSDSNVGGDGDEDSADEDSADAYTKSYSLFLQRGARAELAGL